MNPGSKVATHQESCGEGFEPEYKLHCELTDVRVPTPLRDNDGFLLPEFTGHYTRHLEGREPRPTEELRFE